jgi:dipeptide/tripeptide permease
MQTKRESAIEAITNVFIGWSIGVLSNYLVLPIFGYTVGVGKSMGIAATFSTISLVRSYIIRRWFNSKE